MDKIKIIKGDITKIEVDAIVNAAHEGLTGGGGVDGSIHKAAGHKLLGECLNIGGCPTGQARITLGYDLPCSHVIHTVGPVWRGGNHGELRDLVSCYVRSLELAVKYGCKTVAFPAISCGSYCYPVEEAAQIAIATISNFIEKNGKIDEITLVLFEDRTYDDFKKAAEQ